MRILRYVKSMGSIEMKFIIAMLRFLFSRMLRVVTSRVVMKGRKGDRIKGKPTDKTEQDVSDPRSLRTADLHALTEATEVLNNIQKENLSNLLKYIKHMT
jgi:hypothetical protein